MGVCGSKSDTLDAGPQGQYSSPTSSPAKNAQFPNKNKNVQNVRALSTACPSASSTVSRESVNARSVKVESPSRLNPSYASKGANSEAGSVDQANERKPAPPGVYIPSDTFRTPELLEEMVRKYDLPRSEAAKAMEYAESAEYLDVFCFTYCMTGGPMEPKAYKVAGLQGMDKDAILNWVQGNGVSDVKVLDIVEQERQRRARDSFLVEQALLSKNNEENNVQSVANLETLTEAYRERFMEDTDGMDINAVMLYFGITEHTRVAIHKHLHPAKGSANSSLDDTARKKAAHAVALDRFDKWNEAENKSDS